MEEQIDCMNFCPEALVIANGNMPEHSKAIALLKMARLVVCCDGAANAYLDSGKVPDCIIGDGDSLNSVYRSQYADILKLYPDQETNDLTKAVHYLYKQGYRKIAILGATGKREDHTIGNISLLADYYRQGIDARIYTDYGVFIPASGNRTFLCNPGCQVSVFGFATQGLTSDGLRYPIRDFDSWWQGTLNESESSSFEIHCAQGLYLIFITYPDSF